MKTSTIAALLSALVFPGLGHLYLKSFLRGALLAGLSLLSVYLIASSAVHTALDIVAEIERRGIIPDLPTIMAMVEMHSRENSSSLTFPAFSLLAFWLIGIADAYRLGRLRDNAERESSSR